MSLHAEVTDRSHAGHEEVEVQIYKDGACVAEIALATPEHGGDELSGWVIQLGKAPIRWAHVPDRYACSARRRIEEVGRHFVAHRSDPAAA